MIHIEQVKKVVLDNLPDCWAPLEACLSIIGAAMLKDVDHCIGLILVGAPGGRKTTTISLLGTENPLKKLDTFTPASFVSHDASKTEATLRKIDLLPRIQHKIMVIPELSPLFTQRYEDLTKDIGILTAIMDGRGFTSYSGTRGERGYKGDYRFSMIAATVPLDYRVWQALGMLSSRWIFHRLEEATGKGFDLREDFSSKKATCEAVVKCFLKELWSEFASVPWNRLGDNEDLTTLLTQSAQLICRWRGITRRQDSPGGFNPALVEIPNRLAETLYALARGHALLWGRNQIQDEDAFFAIEVNNGNMPEDRARLYKAFIQKGKENWHELVKSVNYSGKLSSNEVAETLDDTLSKREISRVIGCALSTADGVLDELTSLKIIEHDAVHGGYRWIV